MATVLMKEVGHFPTQKIYDLANAVHDDVDDQVSLISRTPRILQITGLTGAASVKVWATVHKDAPAVLVSTVIANAEGGTQVVFDPRFNFVYTEVAVLGDDPIIVWSQS